MFLPVEPCPQVPSGSPVNVELEMENGSFIPDPAPIISTAVLLGIVYSSDPNVKVESVIIGLARLTARILDAFILVNPRPFA